MYVCTEHREKNPVGCFNYSFKNYGISLFAKIPLYPLILFPIILLQFNFIKVSCTCLYFNTSVQNLNKKLHLVSFAFYAIIKNLHCTIQKQL